MPNLDTMLTGIQKASQIISIGLPLASGAINVVTGIIISYKKLRENADGSVDYQIVVSSGKQELAEARASADATLATVNAELERMGKPKIPTA